MPLNMEQTRRLSELRRLFCEGSFSTDDEDEYRALMDEAGNLAYTIDELDGVTSSSLSPVSDLSNTLDCITLARYRTALDALSGLRSPIVFTTTGESARWRSYDTGEEVDDTPKFGLVFTEAKGYHKVLPNGIEQAKYTQLKVNLDDWKEIPKPTVSYEEYKPQNKVLFEEAIRFSGYKSVMPLKYVGPHPTTYECFIVDGNNRSRYVKISVDDSIDTYTHSLAQPFKIAINNKLRTVSHTIGSYLVLDTNKGQRFVKADQSIKCFHKSELEPHVDTTSDIHKLLSTHGEDTKLGIVLNANFKSVVDNMNMKLSLMQWLSGRLNKYGIDWNGTVKTTRRVFICESTHKFIVYNGSMCQRIATNRGCDIENSELFYCDKILAENFRMCNLSGKWYRSQDIVRASIYFTENDGLMYHDDRGHTKPIDSDVMYDGYFNPEFLHSIGYWFHSHHGCYKYGKPDESKRMFFPYSQDVTQVRTSFLKHSSERQEREFNPKLQRKYRYFGAELEVVDQTGNREDGTIKKLGSKVAKYCICKPDASLPAGGVEIISVPATLKYWQTSSLWKFIEEEVPCKALQYKQCGLHIHVSKNTMTPFTLAKVLLFFSEDKNSEFLQWIAGRDYNNFCQKRNKPLLKTETGKLRLSKETKHEVQTSTKENQLTSNDRHAALNICRKTVEFRLFKGDERAVSVLSAMEFCDSIINFCDQSAVGSLIHTDYIAWLEHGIKAYPNLRKKLAVPNKWTKAFEYSPKHVEKEVVLCA